MEELDHKERLDPQDLQDQLELKVTQVMTIPVFQVQMDIKDHQGHKVQ